MSFVSLGFLAFLAVLMLLYYTVPKRGQWILLLAGSVFFYAFAGWSSLIFITVTALSTYFAGIYIGKLASARDAYLKGEGKELDKEAKKAYKAKVKKRTYLIMSLCLILNLGMLAVIKYTDFGISIINGIFKTNIGFLRFALPMGIYHRRVPRKIRAREKRCPLLPVRIVLPAATAGPDQPLR